MIPLKDNISTNHFPVVTVAVIAICLVAFILQMATSGKAGSAPSPQLAKVGYSARDQQTFEYGVIPREITHPGTYCAPLSGSTATCGKRETVQRLTGVNPAPWYLALITSMFMHANLLHILFNMLFLWIFGSNVEDSMGRGRFVAFYLIGGVAATYIQALFNLSGFDSTLPQIGASGAIAAVLGGYLLLYPRARVLTVVFIFFFFTFVEIPAALMLGVWLLLQFIPAVGQQAVGSASGGVAYFAHIGGFAVGLALIHLFAKRRRELPPLSPYPVY